MAQRGFTTHPLVVRRLTVLRTREVTSRMRRITLTGDDLRPFDRSGARQPGFASSAFDDHVKLVFTEGGDLAAALPVQLPHGIEWPPCPDRIARDYTPRRFDPDSGELDLDFVVHGHGPAVTWAQNAVPGDVLHIVGPKSSTVLPGDLDWIVLAGDETALPAIGRFLDERPIDVPARIALIADPGAVQDELVLREGDTIRWVHADPADPSAVEALIRDVVPDTGNGYVWCAGESRSLIPVRRFLKRERGLPKSHVNVTGYWHAEARGQASPAPADAPAAPSAVASPLPWLVTRAALTMGVVDTVADAGTIGLAALAAKTGVPADRLRLMLDPLLGHGVLAGGEDGLGLGPFGERLIDDEHLREEFEGHHADLLLALTELAPALTADIPAWQVRTGGTLRARAEEDAETYAELMESAESLAFNLGGLCADPLWGQVRRAIVTGPGSVAVVEALTEAGHTPAITVVEADVPSTVLRAACADPGAVVWAASPPPADVAVAVLALGHRTDGEIADLLTELRSAAPLAVLVDSSRPDALGPGAAETALLGLAATSRPPRDGRAVARLATAAGWRVEAVRPLGWGVEATTLRAE
ncbi:siderophore-interacting protein [Phytomonospora sp. NPDC050363]|uniref:siderophore-interacting protein n=1 Tax=Phytomonospora sp. NPDC050363 TaxID=3155642 RepID=UPI0033F8CC35